MMEMHLCKIVRRTQFEATYLVSELCPKPLCSRTRAQFVSDLRFSSDRFSWSSGAHLIPIWDVYSSVLAEDFVIFLGFYDQIPG